MLKSYKFTNGKFNLVVFARSLRSARDYVNRQALSSLSHRSLNYVGMGGPSNKLAWVGAVAK